MGKTATNRDSKKRNVDGREAAAAAAVAEELRSAEEELRSAEEAAAAVAEDLKAAAEEVAAEAIREAVGSDETFDFADMVGGSVQAAQQQYILLLSDIGFKFAELFCNYDLKMQTARFAHEERMTELEIEAKQTGLVSKSQILKEFHEAGISVEVQAQADLRL